MKNKVLVIAFIVILIVTGLGPAQNIHANSSADAGIAIFEIGGIDVTGLSNLEVSDPIRDQGAILEIEDFAGLTGIMAKPRPKIEICNPYELVNWDLFNQYKANLHTHTTYSDGIKSPHERIDEYYKNGYSILSLTDHDDYHPRGPLLYPWTVLSEINSDWENRNPDALGMVAVQGVEISAGIHMGSHFNDFVGEASSDEDYVLSQIEVRDGLAQFYHPGRYTLNNPNNLVGWYADKYNKYDCLVGLEVYNGRDLFPRDRQLWDNILMQTLPGKAVWAFGNDDNHVSSRSVDFLLSWNMFILDSLTLGKVKDAYANGVFFVSNKNSPLAPAPPIINSVNLAGDVLTINANGYDRIIWIADGEEVESGDSIDLSALKYRNKYIRAKLVKSQGVYRGRTLIQPIQFLPQESNAKIIVTINDFQVEENRLAEQIIAEGDEILATVIAEDGVTVRHYKVTLIKAAAASLSVGDINGDGVIDVLDVTLLMQHVLEFQTLNEEQKKAADVNGDEKIDVLDVTLVLQHALGFIESFG